MQRIDKSYEIDVPVRAAYNQWTQFEDFPSFMQGVIEVRQLDDTHLRWRATVGGKEKQWEAEITEQIPDQLIAWRSLSGTTSAGQLRFAPVQGERTKISLAMEYEAETPGEKLADLVGVVSRRVDQAMEDFKRFIEKRGLETGGWRGEVHGGEKSGPADIADLPETDLARTSAPRHRRTTP